MDTWEKDMIAGVNRNAEIKRLQEHKANRRIHRKLAAMAVLLAVVLVVKVLWIFVDMPNAVATGISAPCAVVAAWLDGQVWEAAK